MNAPEHDRNHQLLCAWILGETSAEEAREVEQALAASPELRAERERLEQTIHLVQDNLSGDARLSEDSMASLLVAAAAPSRGPESETPIHRFAWYRHPGLQAAAAVTVLLGGVLGILNLDTGSSPSEDTTALVDGRLGERDLYERSSFDAPMATAPAGKPESGDADRLMALEEAEEALEEPAPDESLAARLQSDADGVPALENAPEDLKRDAAEVAATSTAGRKVEGDSSSVEVRARELDRGIKHVKDLLEDAGGAQTERPTEGKNSEVRLAKTAPDQKTAGEELRQQEGQLKDGRVTSGTDDFFLGRGEKAEGADGEAAKGEAAKKRRADSTVAKPNTGPATPGLAGPITPGAPARSGGAYKGPGDSAPPATESLTAERGTRKGGEDPPAPGAGGGGGRGTLGLESIAKGLESELGGDLYFDASGEVLLALGDELLDDESSYEQQVMLRVPLDHGRYRFQRKLTDEELRRLSTLYADRRFQDCRRRPQESPRDMYFRYWGDNPFELTAKDSLSTFSVDVDTASYTLARRYLKEGNLPTRAQVRTEEFLNYFDPDVPAPTEGTFAIQTELAPSLFGGHPDRWMLRVAVRGKEVSKEERSPLALTFVIDTSGSMRENNRLDLVKHAIRLLVGQLDARDSIAMVAYSTDSRLILPMTPATQRGVIESALHPLQPNGSTNAEAGLKMGYAVAETALDPSVQNRVIFLSDGVANVGQTDQDRINDDVARYRQNGVYLNTIGVGMNNHNDVFLEQLADKGDGICDYVDTPEAAQRAIVERFTGALIPIASDVKVQVQFDATQVAGYRLLGYENRAVADADFRNDQIDAGEVGSGHQVVALYELELIAKEGAEEPLATVHLRWKAPKAARQHPLETDVTEITDPVNFADAVDSFAAAGPGYRQSVLVAQFAEFLRRSTHARQDSFASLEQEASKLATELGDDDFHEFVDLVRKTVLLGLPMEHLRTSELSMTIEEYKRFLFLRAQLEELEGLRDSSGLKELRDTNDSLEQKIRDLIHKDLKNRNG